jgi:hypothetical protein
MDGEETTEQAADEVSQRIYNMRGQNVILDIDIAALYGMQTGDINQDVKRNKNRFPEDFMFTLTEQETHSLLSQTVITNTGRGGRRRPTLMPSLSKVWPCCPVSCEANEPYR